MNVTDQNILSISQVVNQVKYSLEHNFSNVWIKGEIASCKPYSSGHIYLTLKDADAELSAVIFSQYAKKLTHQPKSGMEVLVLGNLSLYKPRGQFQIQIKNLYLFGEGELWITFEKLKKKLELEGLFDISLKKSIPSYPQKIGIITSAEGAALQDIINVIKRRAPYIKCYIYPVPVQGHTAPKKIAEAIKNMNQYGKIDLLIVGRGGGSLEDLWSFNDEIVVRSIVHSRIPIITAVGHETDTTLSDYAADYNAPTPSAAAEIATMNLEEILQKLDDLQDGLVHNIYQTLISYSEKIKALQKRHGFFKPKMLLDHWKVKLEEKSYQLKQNINIQIQTKIHRIVTITSKLELLNPDAQLQRGYALAMDKNHKVIYDADHINLNDLLQLRFAKGKLIAQVIKKEK